MWNQANHCFLGVSRVKTPKYWSLWRRKWGSFGQSGKLQLAQKDSRVVFRSVLPFNDHMALYKVFKFCILEVRMITNSRICFVGLLWELNKLRPVKLLDWRLILNKSSIIIIIIHHNHNYLVDLGHGSAWPQPSSSRGMITTEEISKADLVLGPGKIERLLLCKRHTPILWILADVKIQQAGRGPQFSIICSWKALYYR